MPSLQPKQIVHAIEDAFASSTATAVLISDEKSHPRRFYVQTDNTSFPVWIYIWTLTHGGGAARPVNEYRIQLTSVTSPLPLNPDGPTLLLGYEPTLNCFAGFDLRKHITFSRKSPSIQINIDALRTAHRDGFAFVRKGNDEIAIGFRADNLLAYALNSAELHKQGANASIAEMLSRVGRLEKISDTEIKKIPKERQRMLATISRLVRDSDFRNKITVAYNHKCAVTGMQLRLIDAAHILPVGAPESTDEVTNGLSLSPTYHRAYDLGLIYLDETRKMQLNPVKRNELVALRLDGGLHAFENTLGREILLPPDRRQWPDAELIKKANIFRKIQAVV
jgi:putative restriction endonuclease